jgi:hypothetical protein
MQEKKIFDMIESQDSSMQLIHKLYQERNRLNTLLYRQFPELSEICRVVMVVHNSLIIHANGNKATHLVKLKKDSIFNFLIKYSAFKDIIIKNVVKL